jgi:quinol-cytochrome oxidoreductase complex cytochrome b subunit
MNLTRKTQEIIRDNMSMEDLLPTKMPVYVNSFAYIFGVITLSALGFVILTGIILAAFGPQWYHFSNAGHFVNSLHFWGVQIFFAGLISHLITKFFMAAWRDGRWKTWALGIIAFGISVFEAYTGYLSQTNWDSQWISVQAKDAMNALGIGGFFNALDTAQTLTLHVIVIPVILIIFVAIHLLVVRSDGPVKPISDKKDMKSER